MSSKTKQSPSFTAAQVRPVVSAVRDSVSRAETLTKAVRSAKVRFGLKDDGRRRRYNKAVLAQFPEAKRRSVSVTLSRAWSEVLGGSNSPTRKPTLRSKLGRLVEAYGYSKVATTLKALNA